VLETVATTVFVLVHAPPGKRFDSVVLLPAHIYNVPVVAGGTGFTVTVVNEVQPAAVV
jgi:hypothetical protein